MNIRRWTLLDVSQDRYVESFDFSAPDSAAQVGYSVRKRKLHGGLRAGIDVVEIDNGRLAIAVLPDRGLGLWRGQVGDLRLGWQSPVKGPVHPMHVPLFEPSGIGWLSGFDELLCRCGLESNGAPEFGPSGQVTSPLHGRIANLPAHFLELSIDEDQGEISLRGTVDEARLFAGKLRLESTISTRFDSPSLRIVDRVTNFGAEPADLELLYHINIGHPLLAPGAKVHAPVQTLAPRDPHSATDIPNWMTYAAAQAGSQEFAHFAELHTDERDWTRVVLERAGDRRGVELAFNHRQLPCFTLWKCQLPPIDGYVTGIEPGINFPNAKRFEREQGRVAKLASGESRQFELELSVLEDGAALDAALGRVRSLAAKGPCEVLDQPRPGWSA
jgi:galactose mutarotase-like enzyme